MSKYPIVPVKSEVIFPATEGLIPVSRTRSMAAVHKAQAGSGYLVIVLQTKVSTSPMDNPEGKDLCFVGTLCKILTVKAEEQQLEVMLLGEARVEIKSTELVQEDQQEFLYANVVPMADEISRKGFNLSEFLLTLKRMSKLQGQEAIFTPLITDFMNQKVDLSRFLDQVAEFLDVEVKEKQRILEETNLATRAKLLVGYMNQIINLIQVDQEIERKAKEKLFKDNRRHLLKEKFKQLQKELVELGDDSLTPAAPAPGEDFVQKIKAAKLPKDVKKVSEEELKKLELLHPSSSEYNVVRNYLEWIVSIPWDKSSKDNIDLTIALKNLNEDHYGLDKTKQRIIEFLAISKLRNHLRGPILCLAGPPGIGKTSLGKSIARSLNRKFARLSLGGVRDEAEIRGHRRTYVGAMPGKLIQTLKRLGTNNPVILLDEIDKLGQGNQGDPGSALLEVLDPEQNVAFTDHYLDLPVDLSNVLFICTANYLEDIPAPLRDRMEVINLAGYTSNEKKHIALEHLWPEQVKECGLKETQVQIGSSEVELLINHYTREAGVRELQRVLNAVLRGAAQKILAGEKQVILDSTKILAYLGPHKYSPAQAMTTTTPGVVTGLAWTPVGGEILFIEAVKVPGGRGELHLTGSLGEVMKESANVALTYLKANAKLFKLDEEILRTHNFHVHLPAGAVPKDGPSAGMALTTALISLLTNQAVPQELAMTGEISLTGQVLPVGGIKEKIIAAHRAGIKTVLLPEANQAHWEEVPEEVRKELTLHLMKQGQDLLKLVFSGKPV